MSQQDQKQQPIQVHQIAQWAKTDGHTFMFPVGAELFIQKRVDDLKSKKSVYQGHVFLKGTSCDVQFDAKTLEHVHYHDKAEQRAYQVKLNVDSMDLTQIPAIPF